MRLTGRTQHELLFLPRVVEGKDPVNENMLRPIAAEVDWVVQRAMWRTLARAFCGPIGEIVLTADFKRNVCPGFEVSPKKRFGKSNQPIVTFRKTESTLFTPI